MNLKSSEILYSNDYENLLLSPKRKNIINVDFISMISIKKS